MSPEGLSADHRTVFERHAKRLAAIPEFDNYKEDLFRAFKKSLITSAPEVKVAEDAARNSWFNLLGKASRVLGKKYEANIDAIKEMAKTDPYTTYHLTLLKELCNKHDAMPNVIREWEAYAKNFRVLTDSIDRAKVDAGYIFQLHGNELERMAKEHWMEIADRIELAGLSNTMRVLIAVRHLGSFSREDASRYAAHAGMGLTDDQVRSVLGSSKHFESVGYGKYQISASGHEKLMETITKAKKAEIPVSQWARRVHRAPLADLPLAPEELVEKCEELVGTFSPHVDISPARRLANVAHFGELGAALRELPDKPLADELNQKRRSIKKWIKSKKGTPGVKELLGLDTETTAENLSDEWAEFEAEQKRREEDKKDEEEEGEGPEEGEPEEPEEELVPEVVPKKKMSTSELVESVPDDVRKNLGHTAYNMLIGGTKAPIREATEQVATELVNATGMDREDAKKVAKKIVEKEKKDAGL